MTKTPLQRNTPDLLELVCQLHSRALNFPESKEIHSAYLEARTELDKRISEMEGKKINGLSLSSVDFSLLSEDGHRIFYHLLNVAKRVQKMEEPLTASQIEALLKIWEFESVKDKLSAMHNSKGLLKNNISANLTCQNWLRNYGGVAKKTADAPYGAETKAGKQYELGEIVKQKMREQQ